MSLVELLGTIFNLWSVWLVAVGSILTWPIGIVGVILFGILFYQIQLYSDLLEQVYYLVTGFWGWWLWKKKSKTEGKVEVVVSSRSENLTYLLVIGVGSVVLTAVVSRLHIWFPSIFLVAASYPFLDAITTVMSFLAQWLMARGRLESWILWIIVDVIGVGLYFVKGVVFVAALYGIFLVLATKGFINWKKMLDEK